MFHTDIKDELLNMKRYIIGMSMEKNRAESQMISYSSVIIEYIIKLIVYSDIRPQDVNGWIHSVAIWIARADGITLKPSNKKLKEETIRRTLFNFMGTQLKDYLGELYAFEADNLSGKLNHDGKESYPTFDIDYDLAETLMNVCEDIYNVTLPLLTDKQTHKVSEYELLISEIFR